MIRRALLAFLLTYSAAPAQEGVYFHTGNDLYNLCSSADDVDYLQCISYILGVADTFTTLETHCLPDRVTAGQLHSVVLSFLEELPRARQFQAPYLVRTALEEAFPCN